MLESEKMLKNVKTFYSDDRKKIDVEVVIDGLNLIRDVGLRNSLFDFMGLERHYLIPSKLITRNYENDIKYLRVLMKERRVNAKRLSVGCGLHVNTIYKFFKGETDISLSNYRKLVSVLGLEVELEIVSPLIVKSLSKLGEAAGYSRSCGYKFMRADESLGVRKYYRIIGAAKSGKIGLRPVRLENCRSRAGE